MMDYVIDIETDGINATKIHCMVVQKVGEGLGIYVGDDNIRDFLLGLSNDDRLICHNVRRYDHPTLERILKIKIQAALVDTLALSWYLYPEVAKHGLEAWGERLGVAKPEITDWENLTVVEYVHRCKEDVKINTLLWEQQEADLNLLYEGDPSRLIRYLDLKMRQAALQEASRWTLDVPAASVLLGTLESLYGDSTALLGKNMPRIPVYKTKKAYTGDPFNRYGGTNKIFTKWVAFCTEQGYPEDHKEDITFLDSYKEPNPGSVPQVKDWLEQLGWKPCTFKFSSTGKSVAQVRKGDELSPSVKLLLSVHPELKCLEDMTVIKDRIGTVKRLLDNAEGGTVEAAVQGLTNTLRFKHAICVNIPSARKPWGAEIRALLTAKGGNVLCGADLCSLEDRTKQHSMYKYDPEYVEDMQADDFDPHLDLALAAGAVTPAQVAWYKAGNREPAVVQIRHNYKGGNYACTYGVGVTTLASQLGISRKEAAAIHKAYWKRNWALKEIAKDAVTKRSLDKMWLWNPVAELWYVLRSDKDIFSTLNQGMGTFCFDMWVAYIIRHVPQLTAQFHDEVILECQPEEKPKIMQLLYNSIQGVNNLLRLNRELECDVQFSTNYAGVH